MRWVMSMQVALVPLPRGPAIGERKAQTQARVQVEEGGFALDTVQCLLRLVRKQREWSYGTLSAHYVTCSCSGIRAGR